MQTTNYHMHSRYCDGNGNIEDFVQAAANFGFTSIGTSGHAPVPFANNYAIKPEQLSEYVAEVEQLKEMYREETELYMGLEVDVISGLQQHFTETILPYHFDYFIGSVHFIGVHPQTNLPWEFDAGADNFEWGWKELYGQNIKKMAEEFYTAERLVPNFIPGIFIAGHMDRIKRFNIGQKYFNETDSWYRDLVFDTLSAFAQTDIIVELNTAGWRNPIGDAYPSDWICKRCFELGIPMHINTDAHKTDQLRADYSRGAHRLLKAGYTEVLALRNGVWTPELLKE